LGNYGKRKTMKRLMLKQRWLRFGLIFGCTLVPIAVVAKTSLQARYPYDPACAWGRLSNGKGMIHRCLSETEATDIALSDNKLAENKTPTNDKPKESTPSDAKPEQTKPASLPQDVAVSVGPIEASSGDITLGRLGQPLDRYKACLMDNGGLSEKEGALTVKFLVRAEAERAEGAIVDSYKGLSEKAAKCVANVVDRRQVGSPSTAMTEVKLHFKFVTQ